MATTIQGITIQRLIVHEAPLPSESDQGKEPYRSEKLITIDNMDAMKTLTKRLVDALGSDSHAIEMEVEDYKPGSAFHQLSSLIDDKEDGFVGHSSDLADGLTRCQGGGNIKPGIAVIMDGTVASGKSTLRFGAIIKAESDHAFVQERKGKAIELKYVPDLVFSGQQKLLKIGFLLETVRDEATDARKASDFQILVYDHTKSGQGGTKAALYFYKAFLGCRMAQNSPFLNKLFYETATAFFQNPNYGFTTKERAEKRTHLVSYLTNEKPDISGKEFAQLALKPEHRDPFLQELNKAKFPSTSVTKDTSQIRRRLTVRKMLFTSAIGDVRLTCPEESFAKLVTVEEPNDGWTTVKIKGRQETMA
jgi:hypothetical protein